MASNGAQLDSHEDENEHKAFHKNAGGVKTAGSGE